jgi:cbb3-type cytochrome oxidase maturation protein
MRKRLKMDDSILWLELIVGIVVSFTLLGIFVWAVKNGMFDDGKKMMDSPLNDSTQDLQSAIKREQKVKELKEKKRKELEKNKQ